MYKRSIKIIVGSVALLLCVSLSLLAAEAEKDKAQGVQKTTSNDLYSWFTINNLFNWYGNNGNSSYNIVNLQSGLEFPKGSNKQPIYEDGVVWGGFHKGATNPKVGGSTYRQGLQAGPIVTVGGPAESQRAIAADAADPKWRVYRVRPDVTPTTTFASVQAKMEEDAALITRYSTTTAQAVFAQYQSDWNNWPAKDGAPAPFTDKNGNGTYEPNIDIPGQPGADQTLYYVCNDLNTVRLATLSVSTPIGIEMHRTVWGYNLSSALGNTIFASTLMINKSGAALDSTFLVQWSDPDLGEASDDFAGCDVSRSLGYIYNGLNVDNTYGSACPAAGYDFFQGPLVASPGDSAVFRLKYRQGYKNLGMSTFVFFINGSAVYTDPPLGGVGSDVQWYRLMNGRITTSGAPFINPITNEASKFTLDGDPVSGKGWLDGTYGLTPGDRRICLVTGPFTMANGDTQELVTATIVGQGSDRISSVAVLRWYSDLAQSSYDNLFNIPRPPPVPVLNVAQLDGEIVLSWADSVQTSEGMVKVETWNSAGYAFEGYNVYQLPTGSTVVADGVRLATYDLINSVTTIFDDVYDASSGYVLTKPVQFGTDSGIKRSYTATSDALNNTRLVNGSTYNFALTTYSFNPATSAKPTQLESSPVIVTVIPQSPPPGARINSETGQELAVTHSAGNATASAYSTIIDPSRVAGKNYEIRITVTDSVMNPDLGVMVANPKWAVYDVTSNKAVTAPSTDFNFSAANPIVDGVQVGVEGAPFYVAGKELGAQTYTPESHFNWVGVNGGLAFFGGGLDVGYNFRGSTLEPQQVSQSVEVRFTGSKSTGQKAYRFLRTTATGTATYSGFFSQPFTVWDVSNPTSPKQVDFAFLEQSTSTYNDSTWGPGAASGDREYFYFVDQAYTATEKSYYVGKTEGTAIPGLPVTWAGWYTKKVVSNPVYQAGDVWKLQATVPVSTADRWTFTTAGLQPTASTGLAAEDVKNVNVYPNPYIGYNAQESNKYQRFVTFTHLPVNAVIRVFNLAGILVRTMKKEGGGQFYQWNLQNEDGFPVAAGMYIVYIDMPDQGQTKILKLGVIPEQQFLDKW